MSDYCSDLKEAHVPGHGSVATLIIYWSPSKRFVTGMLATVRMPPPFSSFPVQVNFRLSDGVREISQIDVVAPEKKTLTWEVMRAVPIDAVQREADELIRDFINGKWGDTDLAHDLAAGLQTRPGRRQRYDPKAYARLAARYVELVELQRGRPGKPDPAKALAAELHLSRSRVRDLLMLARRKGMLTTNGQGSAGGELTHLARSLLEEA